MKKDELYETLRKRALDLSKTITLYLDPEKDIVDVQRAEELLATLRVMDQIRRER